MISRGSEELLLVIFKVSWKEVTSNKFDSKAFKTTHGELYNQYTKPVVTKRFLIALRDGDTLIVTELDRLGRNKADTLKELQYYKEHNIRVNRQ